MSAPHQPSISVVIPAYNEEGYIHKCLESLLSQEIAADEIIVVDNNSSDQTVEIARQYQGVQVITEPVQGIVHARNAGFNAAKSAVIARCDADSILPKNWITRILETFQDPNIAAVSGPCNFHDLPKQFQNLGPSIRSGHTLMYFKGSKAMLGHEVLFGSNMAITRDIWNKVKDEVCLDESKMHEDTDLAIHIHRAGGVIKYDPKLRASISARERAGTVQAKSSIQELIAYIGRWPKTKLLHPPIKKQKRES